MKKNSQNNNININIDIVNSNSMYYVLCIYMNMNTQDRVAVLSVLYYVIHYMYYIPYVCM